MGYGAKPGVVVHDACSKDLGFFVPAKGNYRILIGVPEFRRHGLPSNQTLELYARLTEFLAGCEGEWSALTTEDSAMMNHRTNGEFKAHKIFTFRDEQEATMFMFKFNGAAYGKKKKMRVSKRNSA